MDPFLIITPLVSIIVAILGALVGGYMSRAASLEAIEKAHKNNLELQEKNRKDDAYNRLIEAMHDVKNTAIQLLNDEVGEYSIPPQRKNYLKRLQESADDQICKAIDTDRFLLSSEMRFRLRQYERDMSEAWEARGADYLEAVKNSAGRCLEDIIEIARRDLTA